MKDVYNNQSSIWLRSKKFFNFVKMSSTVPSQYFGIGLFTLVGVYTLLNKSAPNHPKKQKPSVTLETPASCDACVDFLVPPSLPPTDKELFEFFLEK